MVRGRRAEEPELLPRGVAYDEWRDLHDRTLELLLRQFDAEQLEWDLYEAQCKAAVAAREHGLEVSDPVWPSTISSVFSCIRWCAAMSPERRRDVVRECSARRRPMPAFTTDGLADFVEWIVGEAMARGVGSDFDTAYQVWFMIADLLLRDSDIGAIVARVHPGSLERSTSSSSRDNEISNAALARNERKRVNAKRISFGYSSARIL